ILAWPHTRTPKGRTLTASERSVPNYSARHQYCLEYSGTRAAGLPLPGDGFDASAYRAGGSVVVLGGQPCGGVAFGEWLEVLEKATTRSNAASDGRRER